jgi:hypothetical protein
MNVEWGGYGVQAVHDSLQGKITRGDPVLRWSR